MDKTIKVITKNHYGNENVYIVSDQAEAIQQLTNRKTITQKDITALKTLGFIFEAETVQLNF